jgi:ribosomal protein L37AE/L43A
MDYTYSIYINDGLACILSMVTKMKICPCCNSNNVCDVDGYIFGCNDCNQEWNEDE